MSPDTCPASPYRIKPRQRGPSLVPVVRYEPLARSPSLGLQSPYTARQSCAEIIDEQACRKRPRRAASAAALPLRCEPLLPTRGPWPSRMAEWE